MAPTIASTVADRPAAQVFAYATEPTRFREWQQGVIDGHLDPPGPAPVDTKCLTTRRISGASHLRAGRRAREPGSLRSIAPVKEKLTQFDLNLPYSRTVEMYRSSGMLKPDCRTRAAAVGRIQSRAGPTAARNGSELANHGPGLAG